MAEEQYYTVAVSLMVVGFYLLSWYFTAEGKLSRAQHRLIWNTVLMVSFVITALLGYILSIRESSDTDLHPKISGDRFWHVVAGIVLVFTGFLHLYWHLRYFRRLFDRFKTLEAEAVDE